MKFKTTFGKVGKKDEEDVAIAKKKRRDNKKVQPKVSIKDASIDTNSFQTRES